MERSGRGSYGFAVLGLDLAGPLAGQTNNGFNGTDEHPDGRRRESVSSGSSYDPATVLLTEIDAVQDTVTPKRKPSPAGDANEDRGVAKRRRLAVASAGQDQGSGLISSTDRSKQLYPEIWHHIFTFVPPRFLGNLLLVNKLFHNYLHPSPHVVVSYPQHTDQTALLTGESTSVPPSKPLPLLNPDAIWQASRRLFWPRMPAPLKDRTELDMWRLVCSRTCQFCNHKDDGRSTASTTPGPRGPGADGVATVFPFFVVSCASCLVNNSRKEIDVLLSNETPAMLLSALEPIFLTQAHHVLTQQIVQNSSDTAKSHFTKLYWKDHLEGITTEFETVRRLSQAAAEEWLKGLAARGNKALADSSRWEKWEDSGGVQHMRHTQTQPTSTATSPPKSPPRQNVSEKPREQVASKTGATHTDAEANDGSGRVPSRAQGRTRERAQQRKKTKQEVRELKQQRKSDIEHRAALLDPPLTPAVLARMPCFKAAIQIAEPLDDNAWKLLQDRLMTQRQRAELREDNARMKVKIEHGSRQGSNLLSIPRREPTEVTDEEWDEIQGPVRTRINNYANEIIRDGWGNGESVSKHNCTQFAAEVLVYVRKRFYAKVAEDNAAAIAAGRDPVVDPPEGPWTQKLTLENMKWVYEVKIRPFTDKHRKDLFFCNDCPMKMRYYEFDGLIQHYAAKHTKAFTLGKIVAYWRSEWPETPPFHPDPQGGTTRPSSSAGKWLNAPQVQPNAGSSNSGGTHNGNRGPATYNSGTAPQHEHHNTGRQAQSGSVHGPHAIDSTVASHEGSLPPTYPPPGLRGHNASGSHDQLDNPNGNSSMDNKYDIRIDYMATVILRTWKDVGRVKGLPGSLQFCVIVHHIAKGFQSHFAESPRLEMLKETLQKRKDLKPIRTIKKLRCKACQKNGASKARHGWTPLELLQHFRQKHTRRAGRELDWRTEMICLPDKSILNSLPRILANDRAARDTVVDALPWAFAEERPTQSGPSAAAQPDEGHNGHSDSQRQQNDSFSQPPRHWTSTTSDQGRSQVDLRPSHEVYGTREPAQAQTQPNHRQGENSYNTGEWRGTDRPVSAPERADVEINPPYVATEEAPTYPSGRGFDLVDSRLQDAYGQEPRAPVIQGDIRPDRYHQRDPARPPPAQPVYAHTPGHAHYPEVYSGLTRSYEPVRHAPARADEIQYLGQRQRVPTRPVGEYELLEVRDPLQGTYYIRRPIQREAYTLGARIERQQYYPAAAPSNVAYFDTGRPAAPMEDVMEYHPRFPGGETQGWHMRHG